MTVCRHSETHEDFVYRQTNEQSDPQITILTSLIVATDYQLESITSAVEWCSPKKDVSSSHDT